jgi:hypothetical protein
MLRAIPVALVAIVMAVGACALSSAATIRVPLDQPTIQEGIDAASEGDTVLVAPGTYTGENNRGLSFGGINMVVMSESGPELTTIDCGGDNLAFRIDDGETEASLVRGFTITNGGGRTNGGGMSIYEADVTIEDCVFIGNTANSNAGGIWYGYNNATGSVSGCIFIGNTARYRAGGMMADHATVNISDCVFYQNTVTTDGGESYAGGAAIYGNSSTVTVTGCTIARNSATTGAGGIRSYASSIAAEHCIVAYSLSGESLDGVSATECVIYGNAGGDSLLVGGRDNLYVDPLLCDVDGGDLSLCSNSVCLPGSPENPWGVLVGALEQGCGECTTPVEEMSWGRIRALFR